MKLLALDIASEVGCCDGEVGGAPRLWSWRLSGTRPQKLLRFYRHLTLGFQKNHYDAVVYEGPMPLAANLRWNKDTQETEFMSSERAVAFVRGMIGVLEMTCEAYELPVEALGVQAGRRAVLGWSRNTGKLMTKDRVYFEVTSLFKVPAQNHNEADAYVTWYFACSRLNPRLAVAATPLFREAKIMED